MTSQFDLTHWNDNCFFWILPMPLFRYSPTSRGQWRAALRTRLIATDGFSARFSATSPDGTRIRVSMRRYNPWNHLSACDSHLSTYVRPGYKSKEISVLKIVFIFVKWSPNQCIMCLYWNFSSENVYLILYMSYTFWCTILDINFLKTNSHSDTLLASNKQFFSLIQLILRYYVYLFSFLLHKNNSSTLHCIAIRTIITAVMLCKINDSLHCTSIHFITQSRSAPVTQALWQCSEHRPEARQTPSPTSSTLRTTDTSATSGTTVWLR